MATKAKTKAVSSRTASHHVKPKKKSHRKYKANREQVQKELFQIQQDHEGLLKENRKMAYALARFLCGGIEDQKAAIASFLELIDQDVKFASRMVHIMDTNPHLKAAMPELYERAQRLSKPGQRLM